MLQNAGSQQSNEVRDRTTTEEETLTENECEIIEVTKKPIPLIELTDDTPVQTDNQGPLFVNLDDSDEVTKLGSSEEMVHIRCSEGDSEGNQGVVILSSSQENDGRDNRNGESEENQSVVILSSSQENNEKGDSEISQGVLISNEEDTISANSTQELPECIENENAGENPEALEPGELPPKSDPPVKEGTTTVSNAKEPEDPIETNTVSGSGVEVSKENVLENDEPETAISVTIDEGRVGASVTHSSEANGIEEVPPQDVLLLSDVVAVTSEEVDDSLESDRKKCLQKLPTISSHRTHNTKTDQRRVLCLDCNVRICPICCCNFTGHLKNHLSAGTVIELCETCGASFPSRCALEVSYSRSIPTKYIWRYKA